MKYLGFFERNFADVEKILELYKQVLDEREKGSDMFPKTLLFESHTLAGELYKRSRDLQGFFIFETDKEEHLINYMLHYAPYMDFRFIPLTEDRKTAEARLGLKK